MKESTRGKATWMSCTGMVLLSLFATWTNHPSFTFVRAFAIQSILVMLWMWKKTFPEGYADAEYFFPRVVGYGAVALVGVLSTVVGALAHGAAFVVISAFIILPKRAIAALS